MRINQAYSTLHDPAARAEYDREILQMTTPAARLKAPPEDSRIAREQFTKGLALLGLVEARSLPAAQPAATEREPASATAKSELRDDADIHSLRGKVAAQMERLASLSLYQILGVTPESDVDTIKRSYIALAKEFHPDRFFRPEFADL